MPTQTYNTTGTYTLTLPATVGEFEFDVRGAGGGGSGSDAGSPGATGGAGARFTGNATVNPGSTIVINVGSGGGGGASSSGGAPGGSGGSVASTGGNGGNGGNAGTSGSSGGGGGGGACSYIALEAGAPVGGAIVYNQTFTAGTTIVIPAGINTVNYTVKGAQGGKGGDSTDVSPGGTAGGDVAPRGQGGQVISGSLFNVGGKTVSLIVGTRGQNGVGNQVGSAAGGTGGGGVVLGGVGAASSTQIETWRTSAGGGGGGGDSAIRVDTDGNIIAVMAGGGGGSGGSGYSLGDPSSTIYSADTRLSTTYSPSNGGNANSVLASSSNSGGGGGGAGSPGGNGGFGYNSGNHIAGGVGQGGGGYYNTSYTTDAALGDTNGNRNETGTAENGSININYTNVGTGDLLVCAGGGAGAGGAGNDGSGPSGFQFGGDGASSFSGSSNITSGGNASNNGGDGGAGGGGGGGTQGGSAGFTPGSDSDAGGGTGGGSYSNGTYITSITYQSGGRPAGGGQSAAGSTGYVSITYTDNDGNPNPVSNFPTVTNADVNTSYTTTGTVAVAGINITVPASSVNGSIIKNGTNVGTSTTVVNGDNLGLTMTSAPNFSTTRTGTLTFGLAGQTVSAAWNVITKDPPNNIPNAFDFTDVTEQPLGTPITSNSVTISGLTEQADVSCSAITSGAASTVTLVINGTDTGSTTGTINNGDTLQLRVTTAATVNTESVASVTVGGGAAVDWSVTTILQEDTAPNTFNFIDVVDAPGGTMVESNVQTLTGFNTAALIAMSPNTNGIQVKINGGAWVTPGATTTILPNQTLQLRGPAPSAANDTINTTVLVGTVATGQVTDTWRITTGAANDTTPDQFTFNDRTNQDQNAVVYSNQVFLTGMTAPAAISVTASGTGSAKAISLDSGTTWQAVPYTGTINPATQNMRLRLTTGAYGSGAANIAVTVGGVSDTWGVGTLATAPVGQNKSTWYNSTPGTKQDGLAIGTIIPIFRDSQGNWGQLDGELDSRYPGFRECDGASLSAEDYPDLFEVIGNRYGGSAAKTVSGNTTTYSGSFQLPNIRNRRLFGTGNIDGNQGGSPLAPTRKGPAGVGTGSANTVGSVGGDWFIDTVDAGGNLPLEQVEGTGNTGTSGQFYALGNIETTGYDGVASNVISFNVAGNISATCGPLIETIVETPGHIHQVLSGTVLNTTSGLMAWGSRGTITNGTRLNTNDTSNLLPGGPTAPNSGLGGPRFDATVSYTNYWASPKDGSLQLQNNSGNQVGAIDVLATTASTRIYSPEGGLKTHNHYLSTTEYGDSANAYGWGNVNGPGTKTSGLGGANDGTVEVAFTHTELGARVNRGKFELSSAKALIPDVVLRPNVTIPLVQPFFRVKYLIKAY